MIDGNFALHETKVQCKAMCMSMVCLREELASNRRMLQFPNFIAIYFSASFDCTTNNISALFEHCPRNNFIARSHFTFAADITFLTLKTLPCLGREVLQMFWMFYWIYLNETILCTKHCRETCENRCYTVKSHENNKIIFQIYLQFTQPVRKVDSLACHNRNINCAAAAMYNTTRYVSNNVCATHRPQRMAYFAGL